MDCPGRVVCAVTLSGCRRGFLLAAGDAGRRSAAAVRGEPDSSGRAWRERAIVTRAWKFSLQDWLDLASYTAEVVLPIFESRFPDDNRPRTAIESGSAADAADAAGSAASSGARSAAHAARAAVAAADAMTRKADAAAYAAQAVKSADGAAHGISAAVRADVHNEIEVWLRARISMKELLW
jgi:hypothetical protein